MRRLAGADAYHLREESRVQHMHTMKIAVLDPSTAPEPLVFEPLRELAARGIPHIPPFRWQLVEAPFGRPVWIDAPDLDLDYHVRRAAVPSPGGSAELDEVVAYIASTGLERDRPLWQLWFVEGLERGRVAYVMKMHHSIADGVASAKILTDTFEESPVVGDEPPEQLPPAEPRPGRARLLVGNLRYLASLLAAFPDLLKRSLHAVRVVRERKAAGVAAVAPFSGPSTRFDRPLTPHRCFATVTVPLSDLKAVKNAFDCTINDVFVAMAGGALHRYLERHGELPDKPLTASVPVSVRRDDEQDDYGNRVVTWAVSTASHLADPVERLAAVCESTRAARENQEAKGQRFGFEWMEYYPLWELGARKMSRLGQRLLKRPPYNVIVSNVPGPRVPLYMHGARLASLQSVGPLVAGQGLNLTAWSYVDDFTIGVLACREHVPDVRELAGAFPDALEELKLAAEKETGT